MYGGVALIRRRRAFGVLTVGDHFAPLLHVVGRKRVRSVIALTGAETAPASKQAISVDSAQVILRFSSSMDTLELHSNYVAADGEMRGSFDSVCQIRHKSL